MLSRQIRFALLASALSSVIVAACGVKSPNHVAAEAGSSGTAESGGAGAGGAAGNSAGATVDGGQASEAQAGEAGANLAGGAAGMAGAPSSEAGAAGQSQEPGHPILIDTDGDGFEDSTDPDPNDPNVPGDFSTPEKILQDARVKAALAGAKAANVDIPTHTELNAPDVSGYYSTADSSGHFVASGDGSDVGRVAAGTESRLTGYSDATLDTASVYFTNSAAVGFGLSQGTLLRGTASEITQYSHGKQVCTLNGANYAAYYLSIGSAVIDSLTGDWKDQGAVLVTVATQGTLTTACADSMAGNVEATGGWAASVTPLSRFVTAGQLAYMCVDEKAAYAPTETWTRAGGDSCVCALPRTVSCSAP